MAQISAGTVIVTNNSPTVTKIAGGPSWATVQGNFLFGVQTDEVLYPIAAFVAAIGGAQDTLILQAPYQGVSGTVHYVIIQDFTPGLHIPLINTGDLMTGAIYNEAARIEDLQGISGPTSGFMLSSVFDSNQDNVVDGVNGPVILGSTGSILGEFPDAIIVPRYLNHPDQAWAYGPFDDHFDGAVLSSKWIQSAPAGAQIKVGGSMVQLFVFNSVATQCIIQQNVPNRAFLARWKWRFGGPSNIAQNNNVQFYVDIFGAGQASYFRVRFSHVSATAYGQQSNRMMCYVEAGNQAAGTLTVLGSTEWGFEIPPYWQLGYGGTTGNTGIAISYDNVNYFGIINAATPAQSRFNALPAQNIQFVAQGFLGGALMALDWYQLI